MTVKEAILQTLEDTKKFMSTGQIYTHIQNNNYYNFRDGKTPISTVGAHTGDFIRNGDERVARRKLNSGKFEYWLTKYQPDDNQTTTQQIPKNDKKPLLERDLHPLFCAYLKEDNILAKTVYHEKSKNDGSGTWTHPDMVGVKFLDLKDEAARIFQHTCGKNNTFNLYSYELKVKIENDSKLKECYFQAFSNSSWANYGYLVAFDIGNSLKPEMERLNNAFGIGIIELKADPFTSKILYPARKKELDFAMIDKLCANPDFQETIEIVEKYLNADPRYKENTKEELNRHCDEPLKGEENIENYCKKHNIPLDEEENFE